MKRDIKYRFRLQLNIDVWGTYKKGDISTFHISLDSLSRHCIDKQWDILSCDEFIGKKDSEGTDIYENDILKSMIPYENSNEYPLMLVIWDKDACKFTTQQINGGQHTINGNWVYGYTVVDNFHDRSIQLRGRMFRQGQTDNINDTKL